MKIIHISDNHGRFPIVPEGNLMIHSGDLLPNSTRGQVDVEIDFQAKWCKDNLDNLYKLIGSRPFLYCAGNHDYFDPVPFLVDNGMNAINITSNRIVVEVVSYYGFPHIPYIAGKRNYECTSVMMYNVMQELRKELIGLDVLVAHAPMYSVLDRGNGMQLLKNLKLT
jgi:3',5'-cyclic AMP phosphodiesterase CpdA